MVKGTQGESLAPVPVKVVHGGTTLAKFIAGGPPCYLEAPAGSCIIEGRHDGKLRTLQAQSGTAAQDRRR